MAEQVTGLCVRSSYTYKAISVRLTDTVSARHQGDGIHKLLTAYTTQPPPSATSPLQSDRLVQRTFVTGDNAAPYLSVGCLQQRPSAPISLKKTRSNTGKEVPDDRKEGHHRPLCASHTQPALENTSQIRLSTKQQSATLQAPIYYLYINISAFTYKHLRDTVQQRPHLFNKLRAGFGPTANRTLSAAPRATSFFFLLANRSRQTPTSVCYVAKCKPKFVHGCKNLLWSETALPSTGGRSERPD